MAKILLTWLGNTDIRSCQQEKAAGLGPIAGAIVDRGCKKVYVLSDFPKSVGNSYKEWLERTTSAEITLKSVDLKDPMNFEAIYMFAKGLVAEVLRKCQAENIVFDLSPGTSAMAAVWIILCKTIYPQVELIESSMQDEKGNYHVRTTSVPFDISAEILEDIAWDRDEKLKKSLLALPPEAPEFSRIIYKCDKMDRSITMARLAAVRNVPVLILGESGTGKELFARAIHYESLRSKKTFSPLNCGAIVPTLMESELFGHVKGSFTGAVKDRPGLFRKSGGGTVFLDEIGEMDMGLQVKLLRTLQENKVQPVGDEKTYDINIRVIAATHKDLVAEIAKNNFREDLFYRLAVAIIHIPPLRERGTDINLLIDHYMTRINSEFAGQHGYNGPKKISKNARIALRNYHWPGNVRELENTLKRIALWSPNTTISKQDAIDAIVPIRSEAESDLLNQPLGDNFNVNELLYKVAKHYVTRAWQESGKRKSVAARLIGLSSHQTFDNWMDKYSVSDK